MNDPSGSTEPPSLPPKPAELSAATPSPSSVPAQARRAAGTPRAPPSISRVPFFANAAQPEIVRANQKDLYYLSQLTERFEDVTRSLLGTRWLQSWGKELTEGSRLAYFGLTTLLGSQTLGEEYCDIMQYSVGTRKPPTARRRAAMLSLHIFAPYVLARLYAHVRRTLIARHEATERVRTSLDSLFASSPPPPPPKRWIDRLASIAIDFPTFETLTEDYLRSVHLAVFYLWGRYYNLSMRASGIRFISTQARRSVGASTEATATSPPSSYEVLGVLMVIQIVVRTLIALRRRRAAAVAPSEPLISPPKATTTTKTFTVDGRALDAIVFDPDDPEQASPYPEDEEGVDVRDQRCTLCLGTRRDPTATECGHVFCWECVVGWAREKPECPLCRQSIHLSKLLPLHNM